MKARPWKNCDRFRRQDSMGAQTPKAAGGNAASFRASDPFSPLHSGTAGVEGTRDAVESTWHRANINLDAASHDDMHCIDRDIETCSLEDITAKDVRSSSSTPSGYRNIPEQLAELIMRMIPGPEGEELGEAFREAAELPPITKQSLSELDIQNIITNIKLRHDVNFDRDLSFRPNLDGAKGAEKHKTATRYWRALVAELELYVRLFKGSPSLWNLDHIDCSEILQHSQRRIPKMFETIQDVLKSLVPDRDHSRVDEHLDVRMLMQEIERGVCDLVRLAEWMAYLLKEHCAPMRDVWVDKMVNFTREGVSTNSTALIVKGLSELMGILEAMKLDVANHQIRNLKTLLIEDTINFERHYHLDRLVNGRARVNINSAQNWYSMAVDEFRQQCTPQQRDIGRFQFEVFVRAVGAVLFSGDSHCDFPETFYLDHDRLCTLKAEINDLVFFEICFDMFTQLLNESGYDGTVSKASRHQLHTSVLAILGEGFGHSPQQWMMNSENISAELFRQALILAQLPPSFNFDVLQKTNQHLRAMFVNSFPTHLANLEATLLPHILTTTYKHLHSSPIDLFNNLVAFTPANSLPPTPLFPFSSYTQTNASPSFIGIDTFNPETAKINDISNRVAHIILLHWRTWGPIAYVQEDDNADQTQNPISTSESASPQTQSHASCSTPVVDADTQVVSTMKTGDPPDPAQETQLAHEFSTQ